MLHTCSVVVSTLCMLALCGGCKKPAKEPLEREKSAHEIPKPIPAASFELPKVKPVDGSRWLAVGGGGEPITNQVSLAQDLALVQTTLKSRGTTLFASGPSAQVAVLMQRDPNERLSVHDALAGVFGNPGSLATRYEPAKLLIDGPATSDHVLATLTSALSRAGEPLFVYVGCHGNRGESPRDSSLALWGGFPLNVEDLANVLDRDDAKRPARFVINSCFGGGFADMIFRSAKAELGLRSTNVCGVFAAPWDQEASGCDPNPDRRAQESYALYFLHALSGVDRNGKNRLSAIDLNRDSAVSLLEAHTYARIHAESIDMPTTTSERYLREVVRDEEAKVPATRMDAEESQVIELLGHALELSNEAAVDQKLQELEAVRRDVEDAIEQARAAEEDAYYALRIALLERFPLLDHPWESRTQALIKREGKTILRIIEESEASSAHAQAQRELDDALAQEDVLRVSLARVSRLKRAYETARLAEALEKRGGDALASYRALRACERFVPIQNER